ncbi:MAG: BON domain-containing protein [Burkholderiaceae bacterium]
MKPRFSRPTLWFAASLSISALSSLLGGCFPMLATSIGASAIAVADRRTLGAQIEDQSIQARGNQRLKEVLPGDDNAYVTVNSFNRRVLLVGQAPDEQTRERAAQLAGTLGNISMIHNEIRVGGPLVSAAKDTALTARVRAKLIGIKDFDANAVRIVSEDSVVYLMGIVTEREGRIASEAAAEVSGVRSVVTLYDLITEQQLAELYRRPPENTGPPRAQ